MPNNMGKISWDDGAADETKAHFLAVATQVDELIRRRTSEVHAAMSEFFARGVSSVYSDAEHRWNSAADEVHTTIVTLRATLERNGQTAHSTNAQAGRYADAIRIA